MRFNRWPAASEAEGRFVMLAGTVLGLVGALLFGLGLLLDPRQAYLSYLTAYLTGLSLVWGALSMLMISHLTGAAWFGGFRRAAEVIAATTPVFALLFLPLVAGMHLLYPWVPPLAGLDAATRESIAARSAWLNVPFFLVRAALYFAVWIGVSLLLRRWSLERERRPGAAPVTRSRALSAGALPAVALTLTFAAFDWMMSLSPDWYSTIYGVYVFAGGFIAALGLLAATASSAPRSGLLEREASPDSYRSLGNLLLAFVIFWVYLGFSQLLIIWIANIPTEVAWYVPRVHGSWAMLGLLLLAGNFAVPFLLLLFLRFKCSPRAMAGLGLWLLAMHYLDIYWLLVPQLYPAGVHVSWLDLATLAGVSGVALTYGAWQLRRHSLVRAVE